MIKQVFIIIFLFILFVYPTEIYAAIVINEIMPHPENGPDWIELYNSEKNNEDLSGWTISDSSSVLITFPDGTKFSTTSAFLKIDKSNRLNNNGDTVILADKSGQKVDEKMYTADPGINLTLGRYPDGSPNWGVLDFATPQSDNTHFRIIQASPTPYISPTHKAIMTATRAVSITQQIIPTSTPEPANTPLLTSFESHKQFIQNTTTTPESVKGSTESGLILGTEELVSSNGSSLASRNYSFNIIYYMLGGGVLCIGIAVVKSIKEIGMKKTI